MQCNVMGKRQVYDRVCTNEIRFNRVPYSELYYWDKAIATHGFRCVKRTYYGVKLEGVTVPQRFANLTCKYDVADLYREIDRIENGIVHAGKIDWYEVVSRELTELNTYWKKACDDIQESQRRNREETAGMSESEFWKWAERKATEQPKQSQGNPKKRLRKQLIAAEEKRRAEARATEYRALCEARKPAKDKPKATVKRKEEAPKPKVKKTVKEPARIVYPELFESIKSDVNGNEFGEMSLF